MRVGSAFGLVCLSVLAASCGEEDGSSEKDKFIVENDDANTPQGFFLADSELQNSAGFPKLHALTAKAWVERDEDLFANPETDETQEESRDDDEAMHADACLDELTKNPQYRGRGENLTLLINRELKNCRYEDDTNGRKTSYLISGKVKAFVQMTCRGVDFSDYVPHDDTIDIQSHCKSARESTLIGAFSSELSLTATLSQETESIVISMEAKTVNAVYADKSEPCRRSTSGGRMTLENDCINLKRTLFNQSFSNEISSQNPSDIQPSEIDNFKRVVQKKGLTAINDKTVRYYESGQASVEFNNWKGSVTYMDESTPYRCELSNGKESIRCFSEETAQNKSLSLTPREFSPVVTLPSKIRKQLRL